MVKLIDNTSKIIDTLTNIELPYGSSFTTTKTVKKGAWYFEYTHHSGNNLLVAGFKSKTEVVSVTLNQSKFSFYSALDDYVDFNFKPPETEYVAGVGLDLKSFTFFFRQGNEMRVVNASQFIDNKKVDWTVVVRQRGILNSYDIIDVNFGATPFYYSIPFNLNPWEFDYFPSCKQKTTFLYSYLFVYVYFTST